MHNIFNNNNSKNKVVYRNNMKKYGKSDEELFTHNNHISNDIDIDNEIRQIKQTKNKNHKITPYIFDEDIEENNKDKRYKNDYYRNDEDGEQGCGFYKQFSIICSYMTISDDCFETFTDKSMALTLTFFKFIKVMDEFSTALDLFMQSWSKIKTIIL